MLLVSGMAAPDERIVQHRKVIEAAKSAGVKRIGYTSIQGAEEGTAFSPVVQSNRRTEADTCGSGLDWVIRRNGIYIEPDIEYIEIYKKRGEIIAGIYEGICNAAANNVGHVAQAASLFPLFNRMQAGSLHYDKLRPEHTNTFNAFVVEETSKAKVSVSIEPLTE